MNHKKLQGIILFAIICSALPSAKDYARGQLPARQYQCLDKLWTLESNWRPHSVSPTYDHGIPQRHMKHNTKAERKAFLNDELAQIDWGLGYIKHRYDTPCKALAAWMSRANAKGRGGWY